MSGATVYSGFPAASSKEIPRLFHAAFPWLYRPYCIKLKQLDVVMSPPAFVWNPYLTFDLDPCDLCSWLAVPGQPTIDLEVKSQWNGYSMAINLCRTIGPLTFHSQEICPRLKFWSSHRQKAVHMSLTCTSTGVLKKDKANNKRLCKWTNKFISQNNPQYKNTPESSDNFSCSLWKESMLPVAK